MKDYLRIKGYLRTRGFLRACSALQASARALLFASAIGVVAFTVVAFTVPARAQIPVIDTKMVEHNTLQTGQQILENIHEDEKIDFFIRLLLKLSSYDWRDLDGAVAGLEALMDAAEVLGYTRSDLVAVIEEVFPGYENHVNWAEHHTDRIRHIQSSYRAVLLSLQEQERRWDEGLDALGDLRLKITGTITLGHPDGEGSRQTMMEIRAAARLIGQEETMLIRQALMNRALIRNLQLSNATHWRGHQAATLERMLGVR